MMKILGLLRMVVVLSLDFACLYNFTSNVEIATAGTLIVSVYAILGGYLSLWKEGAVHISKLPQWQKNTLETAGKLLAEDIEQTNKTKTKFRLYVVPDNSLNATAYGANCISVTQGTLKSADTVTLAGVIAHEASHILCLDPELCRAIFASVLAIILAMSAASYVVIALIFVAFSVFGLRSPFSILMFKGVTKVSKGVFKALQLGLIAVYKTIVSILSQNAEYRCDAFACELGYGQNLACFLEKIESGSLKKLTLADVLYRTHPPTEKRIAKIERRIYSESLMVQ